MSIVQPPVYTNWIPPLPATPGIMTTQFIQATQQNTYPPLPFDAEEWRERWLKLMRERENGQTAEEYASLHFVPDTAQWLIAWAAFEAGRKA